MTTQPSANARIPICQDWTKPIQRQSDGDAIYLPCTGGVRCAERETNAWHIEPIFDGKAPYAKGFMSKQRLQAFLRQSGLKPIAFHRLGWFHGVYHSSWSPIVPGRKNHLQGPADIWAHIATNLSRSRTTNNLKVMIAPTHEKLAHLLDDRGEAEGRAHSLSLSLRNMDIAVEQVTEFYNEQLVNLMAAGT